MRCDPRHVITTGSHTRRALFLVLQPAPVLGYLYHDNQFSGRCFTAEYIPSKDNGSPSGRACEMAAMISTTMHLEQPGFYYLCSVVA